MNRRRKTTFQNGVIENFGRARRRRPIIESAKWFTATVSINERSSKCRAIDSVSLIIISNRNSFVELKTLEYLSKSK